MDAPTLAALIIGGLIGCAVGILTMCVARMSAPPPASVAVEALRDAYIDGWQDGAAGLPANITRPADLAPH